AENERHHGEVVEAVIQQVHDGERSDDGEWQRQAGDDGGGHVAQEKEDHHHHQGEGEQHGELHIRVAFADGVRTVVQNVHVDRRRQFVAEEREQIFHAVGYGDGVGAGLALYGQDDGAAIEFVFVEPGGGLIVFHAVE